MLSTTTTIVALALAAAAHAGPTFELTPAQRAAGWTVLFDGTSTDAFRGYRRAEFPASGWTIEPDGSLLGTGGGGDIITKASYEDFELVLEWKAAANANSGVIYRVTEANPTPWQSGPEMQILDDAGHGVEPTHSTAAGGLYALYDCAPAKVARPLGEWNEARVVLRDGVVKHYLNGVKVVEADLESDEFARRVADSKFAAFPGFGEASVGHLALQDHGPGVWFRNVRVRRLDAPPAESIALFAGNRLDQWTYHLNAEAAMDDVWTFDGDVLRCAGQPIGYLRTNALYTNFVLTLDWRFDPVTKQAGNSGVLVRMIGEDTVWPKSVEAQLQSGSAGDFWNIGGFTMSATPERTRGRNTKHTHANEHPLGEWNHYEIIVDGGRVTLIVNDEVLNEAWDVEEVAGHICLQSEGVPIHFRNPRVVEIRD